MLAEAHDRWRLGNFVRKRSELPLRHAARSPTVATVSQREMRLIRGIQNMALRGAASAALMACSSLLAGCASTVASITDRTIMSDHFDKPGDENKLKSMSGDRRLVRVVKLTEDQPAPDHRWLICPEPFAGAIIARGTSSALTIVERGNGSDSTSQNATVVDARGEVVRLYQDATHRWCMVRAQGDVTGEVYVARLRELDSLAFDALAGKVAQQRAEAEENAKNAKAANDSKPK